MSFPEIGIIIIVALLVIKPEDFPVILKKLKGIYQYISSFKKQVEHELKTITDIEKLDEENSRINFYLQKIMNLDEKYDGNYSLSEVKAYYHKLIVKKRL